MAAPAATSCQTLSQGATTPLGSALVFASYDAGSDSAYLPYPSRRIQTTVDMTLALVLMDGSAVTWPTTAGLNEDIVCKQIKSTGSTLNSGTIKVYF
jgi:hypothetical protein